MLNYREARAFYDRFGARQDMQGYYEDPALDELLHHADFERAAMVFELGSGTGRLARRLLTDYLPHTAHYHGVDVSATMVGLARERLSQFGERAQVAWSDGTPQFALPDDSIDRFLSTYVLDLLTAADIVNVLREAHRLLQANGRLCLVSLTYSKRGRAQLASWGWERIHAVWPACFGGCRPIRLLEYLAPTQWQIRHHAQVVASNITSEIVVAFPLQVFHGEC